MKLRHFDRLSRCWLEDLQIQNRGTIKGTNEQTLLSPGLRRIFGRKWYCYLSRSRRVAYWRARAFGRGSSGKIVRRAIIGIGRVLWERELETSRKECHSQRPSVLLIRKGKDLLLSEEKELLDLVKEDTVEIEQEKEEPPNISSFRRVGAKGVNPLSFGLGGWIFTEVSLNIRVSLTSL